MNVLEACLRYEASIDKRILDRCGSFYEGKRIVDDFFDVHTRYWAFGRESRNIKRCGVLVYPMHDHQQGDGIMFSSFISAIRWINRYGSVDDGDWYELLSRGYVYYVGNSAKLTPISAKIVIDKIFAQIDR